MLKPKAFPPTNASGARTNRRALAKGRIMIKRAIAKFMKKEAVEVSRKLARLIGITKVDEDAKRRAKDAVNHVNIDWSPLVDDIEGYIATVATAGGELSLSQLGEDLVDKFGDRMRERAKDYAADRAAELVGMKWEGDFLVPNPDARWAIDETTRDMLQSYVTEAIKNGDSTDELADRIQDSFAFSDSRAEMIARTEVAKADSEGALIGWEATGQVAGKSWLTAEDDKVSEECMANEAVGPVALDYDYGDGVLAPPQHPNCRCTLLPELIEEVELPQ